MPEMIRNSLLLVAPSPEVQKQVYQRYDAPHWSAGFGMILEKHGFLAFDQADHGILEQPGALSAYDLLIVSWMPEPLWTEAMQRNLRSFAGGLLLEGPVPAGLHELAGFAEIEPGLIEQASMCFPDRDTERVLRERYYGMRSGDTAALATRKTLTKPFRLNRWDFDFDPARMGLADWARRIIQLIHIPLLNRTVDRGPGPTLKDTLFTAALHLLFLRKGGRLQPHQLERVTQLVVLVRREIELQAAGPEEGRPADAIVRLLEVVLGLAEAVGLDLEAAVPDDERQAGFRVGTASKVSIFDRLGMMLVEAEAGMAPLDRQEAVGLLGHLATLSRGEGQTSTEEGPITGVVLPPPYSTRDAAAVSLVLRGLGRSGLADSLLWDIVRNALDYTEGVLSPTLKDDGSTSSRKPGAPYHPLVALAFLAAIDEVGEPTFAGDRFQERYGKRHIDAWASSPLTVQRVASAAAGSTVLVGLRDGTAAVPRGLAHDDYRWVGVLQRGKVAAFAFQGLALAVNYHAVEPLERPFADCDCSTTTTLEPVILMALERVAEAAAAPLARVAPWPSGYRYCLTIRHDVDRMPTPEQFGALLDFEQGSGLGVSWYWIFNRLREDYLHRQEAAGHEIGLHGIKHDQKREEMAILQARLSRQPALYGEFLHGGGGGEYWLGHPSVEASHAAGFDYGEGNSMIFDYPHRWPWVTPEGEVRLLDLVCLSHAVSVDKPPREDGSLAFNVERVRAIAGIGGHAMLLNHPDAYLENLKRIVEEVLPAEGRLDWTCKQIADWWRATHCREQLGLRTGRAGIALAPRRDARGVVVDVAGLPDSAALPAGFREVEPARGPSGLAYRRFVTDLVAERDQTAPRRSAIRRALGRLARRWQPQLARTDVSQ